MANHKRSSRLFVFAEHAMSPFAQAPRSFTHNCPGGLKHGHMYVRVLCCSTSYESLRTRRGSQRRHGSRRSHDEAASSAIAAGYENISGIHACRTADMVILDDLARLHEEKADQGSVFPLLYFRLRT